MNHPSDSGELTDVIEGLRADLRRNGSAIHELARSGVLADDEGLELLLGALETNAASDVAKHLVGLAIEIYSVPGVRDALTPQSSRAVIKRIDFGAELQKTAAAAPRHPQGLEELRLFTLGENPTFNFSAMTGLALLRLADGSARELELTARALPDHLPGHLSRWAMETFPDQDLRRRCASAALAGGCNAESLVQGAVYLSIHKGLVIRPWLMAIADTGNIRAAAQIQACRTQGFDDMESPLIRRTIDALEEVGSILDRRSAARITSTGLTMAAP